MPLAFITNKKELVNPKDFLKALEPVYQSGTGLSAALTEIKEKFGDYQLFVNQERWYQIREWIEELGAEILDEEFKSFLAEFSLGEKEDGHGELAEFFTKGRFCELRVMLAFLQLNLVAEISLVKPLSKLDTYGQDLVIIMRGGKELAVQVKAGQGKNLGQGRKARQKRKNSPTLVVKNVWNLTLPELKTNIEILFKQVK